jgi:pumilio family protein 6
MHSSQADLCLCRFNSTQKEALAQAMFHRLVLEYLQAIYAFLTPEEADKKMHELLDSSIESLADIVHTKDGSAVARELLARGVAKDRKNILRVLKPHLEKLCQDAEAQMVLFTAFDVVDDTKMMAKAILAVSTSPLYSAIFSKFFLTGYRSYGSCSGGT